MICQYDIKFAGGRVKEGVVLTNEELHRLKSGEQLFPSDGVVVAYRDHTTAIVVGIPRIVE